MNAFLLDDLVLASHPWRHDGAWLPFFPLFPLLVLALWLVVFLSIGRRWRPHRLSGESVLAERYARGEIAEDEYRERRAVLRAKR